MALSLTDLFPLRSSRHSARSSASHPLYRKHGHARAAVRPSKIGFETLEPRVLLSGDGVVGGLSASIVNGLNAVGTELGQLVDDNPQFGKYVPGVVETLTLGDNVYQVSPTLRDALNVSADQSTALKVGDPNFVSFGYSGPASSLVARYQYVASDFTFARNFVGDNGVAELALRAMDLDNNGKVSMDEAFKVLVVGQIGDFIANGNSGSGDADSVAAAVKGFIDGGFGGIGVPSSVGPFFDLDVDGASGGYDDHSKSLQWDMDFSLVMFSKLWQPSSGDFVSTDRFDLGHEGSDLSIALDPGTPPNSNPSPFTLPVARTLSFGSLVFGVRGADDGNVANGDFFFAATDRAADPNDGISIGVSVGTPADPYDALIDVNIGFLGASVQPAADNGVVLSMELAGGATDPSNPIAIGFTEAQQGSVNVGGSITASGAIDFGKLVTTPIELTLKIGTALIAQTTQIKLPAGSYADAAAIASALNTQIGASALAGIITASDSGGHVKLEVAASNPAPLGFNVETGYAASLTAANVPTLIGSTTPQVVTFLMSVGGKPPRLVTVTTTPVGDDDGDPNTPVTNQLSLTGLRADLQNALDAAGFGVTVTAGIVGGKLTISATGGVELSRTLTLDTLDQITLAELQGPAQSFNVSPSADARFLVNLDVTAKSGLQTDTNANYTPSGTIKVDIDPFTDVKKVVIDLDPPTGTAIVSADFLLTDAADVALKSGNSDLQDLLDFNVIGVADILGIFTQVGNWFDRLSASDMLQAFDIPFASTSLGNLLNLKDLIHDTFLIDDKDDGPNKSGPNIDTEKLLRWVGAAGKEELRALFGTAQQLEARLNALLPIDVDGTVFTDAQGRQNLTYRLSVANIAIDVDPQTAGSQPLTVPLDFAIDLDPLASFETGGKLSIGANGDIGFTLGVILGNAAEVLNKTTTTVASLNSDAGVKLNTNLALTSLGVIDPLVGRLSGDAHLTITIRVGNTLTDYQVTLTKSATGDNKTLADLVGDLNVALANAGLSGKMVAEADPVQGTTKTAHLVLRAVDATIAQFQVVTATNDTAYTELGFQTQAAFSVGLIGTKAVPSAAPGIDVPLTIVVWRGGAQTAYSFTLGVAATQDNVALQSLIDDLNAALPAASGIRASQSGGRLVLAAVDGSITAFTVNDADKLGLDVDAANQALVDGGVVTVPTTLVAGAQWRGGAAPKDPFGRLDVDVTFSVNGQAVTLTQGDTANNGSTDDLVRTLNQAINANASLKGKIAAFNDGNRVALRVIDPAVAALAVTGLSSNEGAALGLANTPAATGNLLVRGTSNAPVSYGVSETTTFTFTINDGTNHTYSATLTRDNTITNRTLFDLAASLNSAMNSSAIGGAGRNPLIATVQGGQIVIGLKTGAGANLIGDPLTTTLSGGIAASTMQGFSVNSTDARFASELKLNSAANVANVADKADFIIFFADGTSKAITLDALDTNLDQKIDGTLGALITAIETQSAGKVEVLFGSGGTSLLLHDKTVGSSEFKLVAVNGSPAAGQLAVLGSDTASINISEVPAGASVPDGYIDGGRIASIDIVDRVYLKDVGAKAELTVKTVGEVSAEASFGFAGIKIKSGADQTLFSATATLPLFGGQKTLKEMFDAFSDPTGAALTSLVGDPTLKLHGNFDLKVEILPGLNVANFVTPVLPTITFKTDNVVLDLASFNTPLPQGQLFPDLGIDITPNGFGDLLKFKDIKFDNVLAAVQAIADFLNQFEAFGFLGDDIPGLGLSVNDLLDIAKDFQQAVNDIRDNPAGGIQALSQKIQEAFGLPNFANAAERDVFFAGLGLPAPAGLLQLIQFTLDGSILKFDLHLPVGFTKAVNVDLDLGDALGIGLPVDIQGGAGIAASGYLDARLAFGIDLNNPTNLLIYDDTTGVFGHLGAAATNLQFNAAIGPIGAFIKDGSITAALDFNVTGDDGVAGPTSLASFLGNLQAALIGSAAAALPVFFPTDSEYLGDITFGAGFSLDSSDGLQIDSPTLGLPDFSNIDLSAINPFGSIPLMLDSLDFFLQGLQDILDGQVFGVDLPLIGNQLQGGADFIESLRKSVLTPIRQYAEQAPELGKELVQKLLFALLGPGSSGVTVTPLGGGSPVGLASFLGLPGNFSGLGLLRDYNGDAAITAADVVTADDGSGALWKFLLGGTAPISIDLAFDLGIPALSLESDAQMDITLSWGLALGLGINTTDGAYILIGDHGAGFGDKELQLALDVGFRDGSSLTGTLGFLQLDIADSNTPDLELEHGDTGTYLHADFSVDLVNSANLSDTKLSFSELGSIQAVVGLSAEAEVNLDITARFDPSLIPATISALLPELNARFVLDWETGNILGADFDFGDSLSLLGFRDVSVNMGSFINDLLKPFVDKIAEVTEPLQPIIDVITAPIPVISDLAGQPISLIDIAGATGYVDPGMIYAIADIVSLVNKIGSGSYGDFALPLGDFMLLDSGSAGSGLLTGADLLKPGYKVSGDSKFDQANLKSFVESTQGVLGSIGDLLNSGTGSSDTKGLVSGLSSGSEGGSGFAFPIFDNPSILFGLLLGKDIPLVTYDLAPFKMEFTYVQKFPVWDALFVRIGGSVGLSIDLAFGYDTAGARQFAEGGFSNPLDLLSGLYVSDTNRPDGTGTDVPELILKGELFAGAELNLGIASAGAEGVIGLEVDFDLYDPDHDGKVRIDELVGNFLYEWNYGSPALAPIAIFDVTGQVYAQLRAFVESLFFKIEFNITPPITLFEFSIPFEREPFLATERGDGSLLLNIGPNAAQRLNGDTRDIDETIFVKSIDGDANHVLVWGMGINESDAQKYKVDPAKGIFGYGGQGNDTIDLSRVTNGIVYAIEGGVGDDKLLGTAAGGSMKGDAGNDTLTGGAGVDAIYGGEGNDKIDGKAGRDVIFGDTGSFSAVTGGTRYRSIVGDKDGDDDITGGDDNDIIFGGGGIDSILGGQGDDIVLGDGGNFDTDGSNLKRKADGRYDVNARGAGANDVISGNGGADALFGGAGNDLVDGGADNDEIEGGDGFDVIYGGSGADKIYGGANDDIIFGFRDPQGTAFGQPGDTGDVAADGIDVVFGEDGNDFIRGQGANDELHGGRGADILFGDAGNDKVFGEAGGDVMFGGADDDTLDGSDGADVVFGDDGLLAYIGFNPLKADFNVVGSRIRFLGGSQLIGDSDAALLAGYVPDAIATSLDLIVTKTLASDGSDSIIGGDGKDIVFGGGGLLDKLFGDLDPAVPDSGPRPNGQDILIGDGGRIELFGRRTARAAAESGGFDGVDEISGNDGSDFIFGGGERDNIHGFQVAAGTPLAGVTDNDIILGDNGEIKFDTSDAKNRVKSVNTTYAGPTDSGKSDTIDGDFGNDVILGGLNSSMDVITGDVGDDILIGDNGEVRFDEDGNLDTLDRVESFRDNLGGIDDISGNGGNDILIGGTAGDLMQGNDGDDILLGDNGKVLFSGNAGRLLIQVAAMPGSSAVDLIATTDTLETYGGADTMHGNVGNDILLGGVNNGGVDLVFGDTGNDVMLGDNGLLDFTYLEGGAGPAEDRSTLDLIRSNLDGRGGVDILSGNAGSDVGIGGTAGDTIYGDDAAASAGAADLGDVLLGDNADVRLLGEPAILNVLGTGIWTITTTDVSNAFGGIDTVSGNAGADVVIGGVFGDVLYGDAATPVNALDGDDVLLGDNGSLDFGADLVANSSAPNDLAPTTRNLLSLDRIESQQSATLGGKDTISGNAGSDIAMGGTDDDAIYGDNAAGTASLAAVPAAQRDKADILLGDNGVVLLVAKGAGAPTGQRLDMLGGSVATVFSTDNAGPATGGKDTVSGNAGGDYILGGVRGDTLYGDQAGGGSTLALTNAQDGDDYILGDNGRLEWLSTGLLGAGEGLDALVRGGDARWNASLPAAFASQNADLTTLDLVTTEQPNNGGRDLIYGDNGRDAVFGGTDADTIYGDTGSETDGIQSTVNGNDLLFGDHGRLYVQLSVLANIHSRNFCAIDIGQADGGEGDQIWGEEGMDILLGQQGDDRLWGDSGDDDLIGGHNVVGGWDELDAAGAIAALLKSPDNGMNDLMDGGSGTDAMAGDNAIIWRRGDDLSPRFRALVDINGNGLTTDTPIYSATESTIVANIGATMQSDPDDSVGRDIELLDHSDAVQATPLGRFGKDVMAGGAGNDTMFGELGDDLMQGDGAIGLAAIAAPYVSRLIAVTDSGEVAPDPDTGRQYFFNIPEQPSDGDDYMEGNGGRDLMYGGLGQDDMIGGSSALFGLNSEDKRPDDADTMFGGAGIDTARNDLGDAVLNTVAKADGSNNYIETTATGHARDADYMMGDNANMYRLVVGGASGTNALDAKDKFLTFNYDNYDTSATPLRIVPRAMQQLDYTLGGADYSADTTDFYNADGARQPVGGPADNGAADLIHGESGDDIIFGMTGSDVLFGDGQDDDIVGGYGNDWISGGTGQDGVLGDDGLIFTSRNSSVFGEALYAVDKLLATDPDAKYSNGNVINELISTPGSLQTAVINKANELKKTIDLVPFSYDRSWIGNDDEFADNAGNTPFADDIIFGGLGSDFLHGGSGDDAISGAEALTAAYVPVYDVNGNEAGVFDLGYSAVGIANALVVNPTHQNPGNVLAFNPEDTDGRHLNNRFRAGEFRLYDEYDPRRKILLNDNGTLNKDDTGTTGKQFLLNFEKADGVYRAGGTVPKATGQQTETYGAVNDDGADMIFGDLGNDWIVGGTGQDHVYGGWGNDLLQVDDNLDTDTADVSGKFDNESPDTHPYYEDRAYGGAGRDILIGNTGGDRLIDWVGEYNSYLVPYAPFGQASVSRTLQPFLPEFLYAQAKADGADPTRLASSADLRNGEPRAELGVVLQKDFAWGDQTGAPADPQAGNIPGGKRDVLRSADFTGNNAQGFVAESGTWAVAGERYEVAPSSASTNKDAISLFDSDVTVPSYFEITAIINAVKPVSGFKANAYVIFDYQSPTDFKFAGIDVSNNKIQIGQRTSGGFQVLASVNMALKADQDYSILLAINGTAVQMVVNGTQSVSYAFQPRRDADGFAYNINAGMYGLGADNAKARIDNVVVQQIPPKITLTATDTFDSGSSTLLAPYTGNWAFTASGRYDAAPATGATIAMAGNDIAASTSSLLKVDAVFTTTASGGVVFDVYSPTDFKWAAVSKATNQVLIGHYTAQRGWVTDAAVARTIGLGDQTLSVTLKGTTASVSLNGLVVLSRVYNAPVVDGGVGTFTRGGTSSFNQFTIVSDDPKFADKTLAATGVTGGTATIQSVSRTTSDSTVTATITSTSGTARTTLLADAAVATQTKESTTTSAVGSTTVLGTASTTAAAPSMDDATAEVAVAGVSTEATPESTSMQLDQPTIDWSQLIVVAEDSQSTRRHDDAANADKTTLWQEDFVVNLGKASRNPNTALRFTI